jgi:DNA-binding transcriptional MerR regulator/mannose-6-phosphate isomerase-like protein (cupin superfamily)
MVSSTARSVPPKKSSASKRPDFAATPSQALRIGALAQQLGISASLIRAWEKLGLTSPVRTRSAYRLFTSDDVKVLRRAVYLRRIQGLNALAIRNQLRQEGLVSHHAKRRLPEPSSIGPRLRRLRLQRAESLATVAEAVGVSVGFLSNLERSQSSASVAVLQKLARYYGLNILDFHSEVDATQPLVRPDERRVLEGGEGVHMELLAWGKITMEPHLFRVAPGAGSGESYSHAGEEFLFMVAGALTIRLEDTEYRLRTGDSFYFASNTPHSWHNPGRKEAQILWINTPPTF